MSVVPLLLFATTSLAFVPRIVSAYPAWSCNYIRPLEDDRPVVERRFPWTTPDGVRSKSKATPSSFTTLSSAIAHLSATPFLPTIAPPSSL
jgi:hypothetical protein